LARTVSFKTSSFVQYLSKLQVSTNKRAQVCGVTCCDVLVSHVPVHAERVNADGIGS
jgi:hypothetical protein